MKFPRLKAVSLRKEIPEITNTSYGTHSLYYHPAKFIPQVVRYCLKNHCLTGQKVLDPFSGSGTTGLEASISNYQSYLLEFNPINEYFYPFKIPNFDTHTLNKIYKSAKMKIKQLFQEIEGSKLDFYNEAFEYWYAPEIFIIFRKIWGFIHSNKTRGRVKSFIVLPLFTTSKYFSYAEHSMPKLFTSKRKRRFVDEGLRKLNLKKEIKKHLLKELEKNYRTIKDLLDNYELKKLPIYYIGQDSYEFPYRKLPKMDCIITSPPYLQAQEYIRTFKLELMWLGYSNREIRRLINLEIPYRKTENKLDSKYCENIRKTLSRESLIKLFDSYFWFTVKTLEQASRRLTKGGRFCVFVGSPLMEGREIKIWKVIYDYFVNKLNYKFVEVLDDRIKARKLFKGRNNLNPTGMKSEYLLVLEK